MRTTLSLDDDLVAELRRIQARSGASWKQVVNDIIRAGVANRATAERAARRPSRTKGVRLGRPIVPDISNVHEVLSLGEGDARR